MADGIMICGDGPLIPRVASYVLASHRAVTIVSKDAGLRVEGADFIESDPTDAGELAKTRVGEVSDLLVICREDWDAAVVVMNSRKLNPEVTIIANVNRENSAEKLYSLGASRVVFPLSVSGNLIASAATSPVLAEFMDRIILTQDIEIGHLEIEEKSGMVGRQLEELEIRQRTGCWILGILKPDETFVPNPGPQATIEAGQTLICLGTSEGLRDFFESAKPSYRQKREGEESI